MLHIHRRLMIPLALVLVATGISFFQGLTAVNAAPPEAATAAGQTGAIRGLVRYREDRKRRWRYRRYYVKNRSQGELAEAVVALQGSHLRLSDKSPKPQLHSINQKDYRFIPESLAIRTGDRIKFSNSDPLLHNVSTGTNKLKSIDFSIRRGENQEHLFPIAGGIRRPLQLSCRFHGSMRGWIFVFDHPFFHVTAEDGTFQWDNVPAGAQKLTVFHAAGELLWEKQITVVAGKTTDVNIDISPDNRLVPPKKP